MKTFQHLFCCFVALLFLVNTVAAQKTFPKNGVFDERDGHYAFTNATIYKSHDQVLENATLIIRKGKVVQVGTGLTIPKSCVTIDLEGKFIYPSFIELHSSYGLPENKPSSQRGRGKPQMLSKKDGAYSWNQALRSEFNAADHFKKDDKKAKEARGIGFGSVLIHDINGISRGSSALVLLADDVEQNLILKGPVAHHLSFSKGTSSQNYPSSLMGSISLLKQTYLDGEWYKKTGHKEEYNISLAAWNDLQALPQIFDVNNRLDILRAATLGKEFGVKYIIKGGGDEYQRLNEIKASGHSLIIPINYPKAYDLTDPFDAQHVELKDLKHWEMAPSNAKQLAGAGINFAITSHGIKKKADFLTKLRKTVKSGLSKQDALKALTSTPAQLIGVSDLIGSLESGKIANFIITSKDIFEKEAKIHHNWIKGKPHVIKGFDDKDLSGKYDLKVNNKTYDLRIAKSKMHIQVDDTTKIDVKSSINGDLVSLSFKPQKKAKELISLSGSIQEKNLFGNGTLANGDWISWSAQYLEAIKEKDKKKEDKKKEEKEQSMGQMMYPFLAHGWSDKPTAQNILFKNATVWTNESDGIIEKGDVHIKDGKIVKVGQNLSAGGATEIDATGKHLTAGVIDEHSHIAISRGVNEGTQASSAEVSIADVVNSEDINIYRQLAGGVTTSQLLHGSANPIGGQSALIKLRWGFTPEQMKFENADPFIKFALGENVKQSNWGDQSRIRFPQTRMGIEQVFEDYFTRAKEYGELKSSGKAYRPDLDLEAVLEIIQGKRFITCHSYQQGEINMLMKVADRHGFKVNTFTHILEGYKVADKMVEHGAAGSTFSDWWAYKFEVIDAIPHNGAIMHEQGVLTAFNSDDAEMARRLNQEAAKAVLYGGVSEEDAWKFVTLNPAKMLHIDNRVGSIKAGKDADIVLWSDNPLSVYANAEMTFVDGIKFFDRNEDKKVREEIKKERARLIQKSLNAKDKGAPTQGVKKWQRHLYHCDDIHDEGAH